MTSWFATTSGHLTEKLSNCGTTEVTTFTSGTDHCTTDSRWFPHTTFQNKPQESLAQKPLGKHTLGHQSMTAAK
ncbi:hypothetical protein E2C01_008756 [Portunus trituberculatus]|uniref:Uncharacterized protein n=1 Tax=Portunus trituberculatus TaxID=210409 RepID=A0A5B7D3U8_PORTR|nr:hypothetical protein [Portunus trituberculatus]